MDELKPVAEPSAWTAAQLMSDDSWIYRFDQTAIDELDAALSRVRHMPITDIRRLDFPLDRVAKDLTKVAAQVEDGIGMAVLRGLPILRYSKDDASRIYSNHNRISLI